MKIANILAGLFFGTWAIGTLCLGISDISAPVLSAAGLNELMAPVAAAAILALIAVWSFQNAYRKLEQPEA